MVTIGFMEELQSNGAVAKSIMRWGFAVMLVFSCLATGYMIVTKTIDLGLVSVLFGYAFAGKVGQKYIEMQGTPKEPTTT